MAETKFGKYVLDSLTASMYKDSECVYREYIQNAADQIDEALESDPNGYYCIHINIYPKERTITIEDNATGVKRDNRDVLRDVARSKKVKGKRKGFRGIGRLGGLGYCKTMIFETSAPGEDVKTMLYWDAAKMREIVDDENDDSEAADVVDLCTQFSECVEKRDAHYFKVIMKGVTDDRLLNVEKIRNYLSMVSPIDYGTSFSLFASKIKKYAKVNGLELDTYNLFLNSEQLYKGYTPYIKDNKNGDYHITDIEFFNQQYENGDFMYWGWYSISEFRGQIPSSNLAYGIRLRSHNIELGDAETCKFFFDAPGDKRFSQYFYGELFVVSKTLLPDARRDYIRECEDRSNFEKFVKRHFFLLKSICQQASDLRSAAKGVEKAVTNQQKIESKKEKGFDSTLEADQSQEQYEKLQKDIEKFKKIYTKKKREIEEKGSPLSFLPSMFEEKTPQLITSENSDINPEGAKHEDTKAVTQQHIADESENKLRTDGINYSCFNEREKRIINSVYGTIYKCFPDETMREILIKKIESEIINIVK